MSELVTLRLSAETLERIDRFAAEHGLTRYDAFGELLSRGLQPRIGERRKS